jgi:hypothetical protein
MGKQSWNPGIMKSSKPGFFSSIGISCIKKYRNTRTAIARVFNSQHSNAHTVSTQVELLNFMLSNGYFKKYMASVIDYLILNFNSIIYILCIYTKQFNKSFYFSSHKYPLPYCTCYNCLIIQLIELTPIYEYFIFS